MLDGDWSSDVCSSDLDAEVSGEERKRLVSRSYELLQQLHERIKAIDLSMRQELKLVEG
jgi:hypothetical protein